MYKKARTGVRKVSTIASGSIRYSVILLKNINCIYNHLFCCNQTCYCIGMASVTSAFRHVTSASRYHPRYQSRSSMYIRGVIPRNFEKLAGGGGGAVPIATY